MGKSSVMLAGIVLIFLQAPLLGPLMGENVILSLGVFLFQSAFVLVSYALLQITPPVGRFVSSMVKVSVFVSLLIFGVAAWIVVTP